MCVCPSEGGIEVHCSACCTLLAFLCLLPCSHKSTEITEKTDHRRLHPVKFVQFLTAGERSPSDRAATIFPFPDKLSPYLNLTMCFSWGESHKLRSSVSSKACWVIHMTWNLCSSHASTLGHRPRLTGSCCPNKSQAKGEEVTELLLHK